MLPRCLVAPEVRFKLGYQLTAELVQIPGPNLNRNEEGAVYKQVNHDPITRLAQQLENLWPRVFFQSLDVLVGLYREKTRNVLCYLTSRAMGDILAIARAQYVLWPSLPEDGSLLEKVPNDIVDNLNKWVSVYYKMDEIIPPSRTSVWEYKVSDGPSESDT